MHLHLVSASLARLFILVRSVVFFLMCTTSTSADMQNAPQLESPPLVRLTGVFAQPDESNSSGPSILQVSVKETKWAFQVEKFEKLTGRPVTDLQLLQSLFPPQLRFSGDPTLLEPLQQQTILGKLLIIEGRLYSDERMLFVISVSDSKQEQ